MILLKLMIGFIVGCQHCLFFKTNHEKRGSISQRPLEWSEVLSNQTVLLQAPHSFVALWLFWIPGANNAKASFYPFGEVSFCSLVEGFD